MLVLFYLLFLFQTIAFIEHHACVCFLVLKRDNTKLLKSNIVNRAWIVHLVVYTLFWVQ